jgi:hypothetical protein
VYFIIDQIQFAPFKIAQFINLQIHTPLLFKLNPKNFKMSNLILLHYKVSVLQFITYKFKRIRHLENN